MYARDTSVSIERSRQEIEMILRRYGATGFAYATNMDKAMVKFSASKRIIMFVLELPREDEKQFTHKTRNGEFTSNKRNEDVSYKLWEQACRQKWRALALAIKAKLECVESGISTFEDEFMAHIVMPNGKTLGEWAKPQIESAYQSGKVPPLLEFK